MPEKISEGDTVGISGEVSIVNDDGTVTLRLRGCELPITTRAEFLTLIAKGPGPGRRSRFGIGRTNLVQ